MLESAVRVGRAGFRFRCGRRRGSRQRARTLDFFSVMGRKENIGRSRCCNMLKEGKGRGQALKQGLSQSRALDRA
jgi:hypothetical protein